MSVTVSFRIPRELKKRMDELKDVNWSEEVRRFLEQRVRELEQLRAIEELERIIERIPRVSSGTAIEYVREDRDSHRCFSSSEVLTRRRWSTESRSFHL